jgi:glycosyltransferase involved in cell wall biosynthesis
MTPTISVNMPVYNGECFVAEAIESILVQTHTDFEFIIVNDASTDGTAAILEQYAQRDSRITVLHNSVHLGEGGVRNRAIEASSGAFIAIMDADDWCARRALPSSSRICTDIQPSGLLEQMHSARM